jgi:hypothetical protein
MEFTVGEVLMGRGESIEAAARHAFHAKLPPLGGTIPTGIKTELLTTQVSTAGYGFLFEIRLKVIEVP